MENKIAVVLDSTTTLPEGFLRDLEVRTAPAVIIWEGKELLDGVDIQPDEFYARLEKAEEMPSTSQATPPMFKQIFEDLHARGFEILAVTISSKLSGMYSSAIQAKEMLKDARIEVVDSLTGTMTVGMSLNKMFEALKGGANLQKCRQVVENSLQNTGLLITVETLDFLHRGGRIGGAQKFLGSALQLKPILEVADGAFLGLEKVRTRGKALNRLADLVVERIGDRRPVEIAALHANAEDVAHQLIEKMRNRIEIAQAYVTGVSPAVGVHLGPGTVGIAFLAGE